jgi:hypothetical protein
VRSHTDSLDEKVLQCFRPPRCCAVESNLYIIHGLTCMSGQRAVACPIPVPTPSGWRGSQTSYTKKSPLTYETIYFSLSRVVRVTSGTRVASNSFLKLVRLVANLPAQQPLSRSLVFHLCGDAPPVVCTEPPAVLGPYFWRAILYVSCSPRLQFRNEFPAHRERFETPRLGRLYQMPLHIVGVKTQHVISW